MYKVKLATAAELTYLGAAVDPAANPLTINNGWNRIGFLPRTNIEVNQALASYNAVSGDIIRSQTQFALYDGNYWLGPLSYMKPGEGYMLWSQTDSSTILYYPAQGTLSNTKSGHSKSIFTFGDKTVNPYAYPGSMSVVARTNVDKLLENAIIGAFINDELRGVASIFTQGGYYENYSMMTVYGDFQDNNSTIDFRLLNNDQIYDLFGNATFSADKMQGTLDSPLELYLESEQLSTDGLSQVLFDFTISPNPFSNNLNISFNLLTSNKVEIEVYNLQGVKISEIVNANLNAGNHVYNWNNDVTNLAVGVFILRLKVGDETYYSKVIKSD